MSARSRDKKRKPRAIDLFSGCGGLTLGLKQAGFDVVAAVEVDDIAVETYKENHPDVLIKHADIRAVSAKGLRRELKIRPGELELLAGCPPCQGFSKLRTRNGGKVNRDRRNKLIEQMLRFARAFRPKAIMMENVPGLAHRQRFRSLCNALERLGYSVAWDIKDVARFGVPQRRKRLILLAGRQAGIPFAAESKRIRTVRATIFKLPKVGEGRDVLHNIQDCRSAKVQQLIRDIPKNGGSRADLGLRRQLKCHRMSDGFSDVYGRMAWDDVAPTITSGCFNPSKGRFLHPRANRNITMREAALLQTFPKSYKFPIGAGKQAIALLIGNALPPEFIRRQAKTIFETVSAS